MDDNPTLCIDDLYDPKGPQRPSSPFRLILVILLIIVIIFPEIALWLPQQMAR